MNPTGLRAVALERSRPMSLVLWKAWKPIIVTLRYGRYHDRALKVRVREGVTSDLHERGRLR